MKISKTQFTTDVQLEYVLAGPEDGQTLLFLHGLGANLRQFELQQKYFAQEYRVLLVSLRGHGNSSGPAQPTPDDYTIRKLARDLQALLSYLHIRQVHFVGNSLGGLVGYELLELDAKRMASLTTFGTTAELHASRFVLGSQLALIRLLGARGMAWLVSKTASKNKAVATQVGQMFRMASKDALALITRNIADYDYTGTIRRHNVPMLLIRGKLDREINARLDSTVTALREKPGSQLIELPEAGHFANLEQPEAFNRALARFLTERERVKA